MKGPFKYRIWRFSIDTGWFRLGNELISCTGWRKLFGPIWWKTASSNDILLS